MFGNCPTLPGAGASLPFSHPAVLLGDSISLSPVAAFVGQAVQRRAELCLISSVTT